MSSIKTALFWNSLQQLGQLGFSFLSTIVLSRLLSTSDYGIFGILVFFISVSEMLSDSGLGAYIIKKKDITPEYYSTLFVYNMVVSILLYVVLYNIAPMVSKLYGYEVLTKAIRVIGIVVILYSFSITQYSKLMKELKFRELALIQLFSGFTAFLVGVLLAYNGYGVWALVYQQIVAVALSTILYVFMYKDIPRLKFNYAIFKESIAFGGFLFMSSIFKMVTDNISNNFIGKAFSLHQTGLFVQANKLCNYPISMTTNVVDRTFFPILSKINNDYNEIRGVTAKLKRQLYSILYPVFGLLIAYSDELVLIVLGKKWECCSVYFKILMMAGFFMLVKAINRNILKSLGKVRTILYMEIVSTITLLLGLFISFYYNSMLFVAYSFLFTQFVTFLISICLVNKFIHDKFLRQIKDVVLFLPISIMPILVRWLLGLSNSSFLISLILPLLVTYLCLRVYIMLNNPEYSNLQQTIKAKLKIKNIH